MGFLLFDAPRETGEVLQGVLEATIGTVRTDTIDQGSRLSPATAGPAGDGRHHLQIPQQSGCGRVSLCLFFGSLAASLQKQRRLFENPGSHPGRAVAPGGVEFTRLAARELV